MINDKNKFTFFKIVELQRMTKKEEKKPHVSEVHQLKRALDLQRMIFMKKKQRDHLNN